MVPSASALPLLLGVWAGLASDVLGSRRMAVVGSLGFVGATALLAAATTIPLLITAAALAGMAHNLRNNSTATGQAAFELVQGGNALPYWLFITNLQNPSQGHIHIGAAGQNGPVAVWLYPSAPPPRPIAGSVTAMVGEGTITAANFVGPLQGRPFSALITALNNGTAYVNVHTSQFPCGEIRGRFARAAPGRGLSPRPVVRRGPAASRVWSPAAGPCRRARG